VEWDTKVPSSSGLCAVCSNLSIEKSLKTESVKVLNKIYFSNVLWGIDVFKNVCFTLHHVKGTVARDFLPLFFSIKRTYLGP
jgi:hypothetical protein